MKVQVLLVEDEASIATNIKLALEQDNFNVESCSTGGAALLLLKDKKKDFIILDVGLPDMSGFDVCKNIRKFSDIPILFLTARNDEIDRVLGLELGADDYLTKPFSPRELVSRVRAILRRCQNKEKTTETSFEINNEKRTITFQRKALSLSKSEYILLSALIQSKGNVLSREQLLDKISNDEPSASSDRSIDTHIKSLRAKIKECDSNADPIKTQRGFGYSISENDTDSNEK